LNSSIASRSTGRFGKNPAKRKANQAPCVTARTLEWKLSIEDRSIRAGLKGGMS
jgi:hypothetical protein